MGTRGLLLVWRYKRRYYAACVHSNTYPEGWGGYLAVRMLGHKDRRAANINAEIKKMKDWDRKWAQCLCRPRADYLDEIGEEDTEAETTAQSDESDHACVPGTSISGGQTFEQYLSSIDQEFYSLPSYAPPLNDFFIEWIYTFDYDNRAFSVNNQLHLSLDNMDNVKWISAFEHRSCNLDDLEPGVLTEIIAAAPTPDQELLHLHDILQVRLVHPQGIRGFPRSHRRGPIFRTCVFERFLAEVSPNLNAGLWSWQANDFPFREIAYVFLSLASSSHMTLVNDQNIAVRRRHVFSDLISSHSGDGEPLEKPEFLSHLWTGSHVQGHIPGSAPNEITYWFQGALVHLTTHLDQLDHLRTRIAFVQQRCLADRPGRSSNALLMSVEHAVFLRIYADGKSVDHSNIRPLFHTSLQYNSPHFWKTQADMIHKPDDNDKITKGEAHNCEVDTANRKGPSQDGDGLGEELAAERTSKGVDQAGNTQQEISIDGCISPKSALRDALTTFTELAHFLEVSACEGLRPWSKEPALPVEIIELILRNVKDVETSRACMQVSPLFRDICLRYCLISNGMVLHAVHWGRKIGIEKTSEADVAVPHRFHQTIWSRCVEADSGDAVLGLIANYRVRSDERVQGYGDMRSCKIGYNGISARIFEHESSILPLPESGLGDIDESKSRRAKPEERYSVVIGDQKHRRTLLQQALLHFQTGGFEIEETESSLL